MRTLHAQYLLVTHLFCTSVMNQPLWNAELGVWEGNLAPDGGIIPEPLIIFGYGSLCWRPDFHHVSQIPGYILGFKRRFWQASMDHRGTPDYPGRVVTLITSEDPSDRVNGIGFVVPKEMASQALLDLDFREKGGYIRQTIDFFPLDGSSASQYRAIVYVGTNDNPNFAPSSDDEHGLSVTANIILKAIGPSGPNIIYFSRLRDFVKLHGLQDDYLDALHDKIEEMQKS